MGRTLRPACGIVATGGGILRIQLLGGFRIAIGGEIVGETRWARKKAETLVKILAVEPGHEIQRERLLELLWPELEPEQALNNLHKAIHAARRALEPDLKSGAESRYLLTNDRRVALQSGNPEPIWIDAEAFEQQAKKALALDPASGNEIEAALALMTGPFLPADRLEDWTAVRRERIVSLHQDLYVRLAGIHERTGDNRQATELLRQAVAVEPVNEEVHRHLMRLYAISGNRHLALSQFRTCCEILRRELDAEPESSTVQLYEQIQGGEMRQSPAPVSPIPVDPAAEPAKQKLGPTRRNLLSLWIGAGFLAAGIASYLFLAKNNNKAPLSLAVLPLNFANAAPNAHIAEGITEGLIANLSRLPRLRVMARSTVYAYRDQVNDPRVVAKALGVGTVLTGRIDRDGDKTQLSVELVDGSDGAHIWGKRYAFSQNELPSITTQVASDLSNALAYDFESPAQRNQLLRNRSTRDSKAYELYLRGRHHWNQRNEAGIRKAIDYFEQAIALDSKYALAYAGLADCYGLLSFENAPPGKSFSMARAMALKALELDDQLAEAHTSLAMVKALHDWEPEQAESGFRRAIALSPGNATAHHWYAVLLNSQGRFAEANAQFASALELDPLSLIVNTNAAYVAHFQRDYNAAAQVYRRVLDLDPNFSAAREDLILALEQAGRFQEASAQVVELLKREGDVDLSSRFPMAATEAEYRRGMQLWQERLESKAHQSYVSPAKLAELAIRAGNNTAAFRHLTAALEERSAPLAYLKLNPLYDPLRKDPRFGTLLERAKLR